MILAPVEKYPEMTEGLLQLAVADRVQWWRGVVVPNLCLFHEMDVAVLTRAGCLWEFEIKCSQSDWNSDKRKDAPQPAPSWAPEHLSRMYPDESARARVLASYTAPSRNLKYVERFHYVYATGLKAPEWVPEWAGLIEARFVAASKYDGRHVQLTEQRPAKGRRAEKPTENHVRAMYEAVYHRYWRRLQNLSVDNQIAAIEGAA